MKYRNMDMNGQKKIIPFFDFYSKGAYVYSWRCLKGQTEIDYIKDFLLDAYKCQKEFSRQNEFWTLTEVIKIAAKQ